MLVSHTNKRPNGQDALMAKKYSRDEIIKHAKALGMDVPSNAATMSKGAYKDFTNSLNKFKAEGKHKEATAKTKAKEYQATDEGKNYVAKAKEAVSRASDEDKASGNISIMDVPASVRAKIDTEIPVTTKFNYTEGLLSDIREASPFVTGARSGGKMDYTGGTQSAKEYQDYVMRYPDLKRAWNEILTNPNSETARYWLPRMGVTDPSDITIDRFGMAHRAENDRLGRNTYIGDTDVRPGGSRWDEWLEGKDPATGQRDPTSDYWKDSILDPDDPNAGGITIIGGTKGIPGTTVPLGTTGLVNYAPGNEFLTTPYTRPALQDWSAIMPEEGLLRSQAQRAIVADQGANFQPWAQGGLIEYSPAGTATYVPRTYTPSGSTGTTGTTSAETATNGYTGPLGNQWDSYQDWYMADRPEIAGLVTTQGTTPLGGHQAAMNRLYANAGGQGLWGSYDAWFKSPRGDAYNAKVSDYKAGQ